MKKKVLFTLLSLACALCCVFGLVACNDVAVTGVTLNKTELTLFVGGEETLTATVAPENATKKEVAWSSDKTDVATVENGKVKAVAVGSATITATAGGKNATCTVTVKGTSVKMTEEEWKASYAAFVAANNYVLQDEYEGEVWITVKADGELLSATESREYIYEKDGDIYYEYFEYRESEDATPVWTKRAMTEEHFEDDYGFMIGMVAAASTAFGESYSSFTFADGKYTAEEIQVGEFGKLTNIEVTSEGNTLKKIVCTLIEGDDEDEEGTGLTIDSIGAVGITVPSVPDVAVTGVTLNRTEIKMEPTDYASLYATVAPITATNAMVTMTSSDPAVAKVEERYGQY
ncbi:MAG: Ig-like domain-containing protein [Clostridia bacterium]|nr:Ig-like domain-containing protein [Clostridia bacterium]